MVVIARRHVAVGPQERSKRCVFAPNDESQFCVRFQRLDTIHDMHTGGLERLRPHNVTLLIETRFQLYENCHFDFVLRCLEQMCHNGAVGAHAVQCGFDGHHLRVACRLCKERRHGAVDMQVKTHRYNREDISKLV